jgi:hypothetical protein
MVENQTNPVRDSNITENNQSTWIFYRHCENINLDRKIIVLTPEDHSKYYTLTCVALGLSFVGFFSSFSWLPKIPFKKIFSYGEMCCCLIKEYSNETRVDVYLDHFEYDHEFNREDISRLILDQMDENGDV